VTIVFFVSFQILAVHILFWQGNLLFPVRKYGANLLDRFVGVKASRFIQKPLWDCLPCMASIWTIILLQYFDLFLILAVCGLNVLLDIVIVNPEDEQPVTE
jgi:hypothetical protein